MEPGSRQRGPRVATRWWIAVAALVVIGLVGALWFGRRSGPKLRGQVLFDERGRPRLELTCGACPEGMQVRSGADVAELVSGHASIALEPPVSLGEQRFEVTLRDANGRVDRQSVPVRVDWIVSADMRGLGQATPRLALVVDADPAIGVIVDGHALPATPGGARRYEIDIREDVTGPANAAARVSRRVPYVITRVDGSATRGELELGTEVVPLRVDAPGDSLVIEGSSFMLAGLTQSDGSVSVEGRPITVDPAGRFAQLMSVSAIGDTSVTVRASAPGRAPRLIPVRVKRVASLATEAELFSRRATNAYTALAEPLDEKLGWAVALTGKVREIKSDGYSTEHPAGRDQRLPTPCPLVARWGARTAAQVGDSITVYGHVAGKSPLPAGGRDQPEVRVEFLRGQP